MPNIVTDLVIDRVDLVEEGANSAAFIELYKRREPIKMTYDELLTSLPAEQSELIKSKMSEVEATKQTEIDTLTADLAKAREDVQTEINRKPCECDGEADENGVCKVCGGRKVKKASFDETEVLKSLPKGMQDYFNLLKSQKEAAEATLRATQEATAQAEAVAKAASLKSLPVPQDKLVTVIKGASSELLDILTTINAAIDTTVLTETGTSKSGIGAKTEANAAWAKIEAEADTICKAKPGLSKQAAISEVVKSKPELYREYLEGGAN